MGECSFGEGGVLGYIYLSSCMIQILGEEFEKKTGLENGLCSLHIDWQDIHYQI